MYLKEKIYENLIKFFAYITILVTIGIIGVLLFETIEFFEEVSLKSFLFDTKWTPLFEEKHFGILPLLLGTFLTSAIALSIAVPFGLVIAVFLSEYASQNLRKTLKPFLELLAGVPTVVYGYFALLTITPILQKIFPTISTFNALSAGIVMGFMIIPIIASLSDDALNSVPQSLREGAYALGSSRYEVSLKIVFPAAFSGIASAVILGLSRAIGETAPLITIGALTYIAFLPTMPLKDDFPFITLKGFMDPFTTLPIQIFNWVSRPQRAFQLKAASAIIILLFIVFLLNGIAIILRLKYQKRLKE